MRTLKKLIGLYVCTRRDTSSSSKIRSFVRASGENLARDSKNLSTYPISTPFLEVIKTNSNQIFGF